MRLRRNRQKCNYIPRVEELESRDVPSASALLDFQAVPAAGFGGVRNNTQIVGFTPAQIRHAYGFDQVAFLAGKSANSAGAGQTIAIVDVADDPNILADANFFSTTFGLPQFNSGPGTPSFTKVNENGSASGPFPMANASWAGEISLDVEWAHAIAPAANIVLVEASSTYLRDLLPAINTARSWMGVSAVSMSWGGAEFSGISADDTYLTTPSGHSGVTFTAATLDNGGYYSNRYTAAYWPAVSPNTLAVGGTVLSLDSNGNYLGETGWSYGGGGLSRYETQPSYQSGVVTQSTTQRANPDVAYAAGGPGFAIYDTVPYNQQIGWFAAQGTSAGTPQWAALVAIANQGRAQLQLPALDGPSQVLPTLYKLYASPSYTSDFNDVKTGNNGNAAGNGYDLVTGLGTPHAGAIVQALLGLPAYTGSASPAAQTSSQSMHQASGPADIVLSPPSEPPISFDAPQATQPSGPAPFSPAPPATSTVTISLSVVPAVVGPPGGQSLAHRLMGSGQPGENDEGPDMFAAPGGDACSS
jgi:subtilase family serine protease